jgi:hypothetical protein
LSERAAHEDFAHVLRKPGLHIASDWSVTVAKAA